MNLQGPRIAVLDYGAANMVSISQALVACGAEAIAVDRPTALQDMQGVVVPGVGAARPAMERLRERGLVEPLLRWVRDGRPCLGICLGYQIMFEASDEGEATALGLMSGRVRRLEEAPTLPHIGWNTVTFTRPSPLFDGIPDGCHFYFVHSYVPEPADEGVVLARTDHGGSFVSAAASQSLFGVQFHPERSGEMGLRLLANFLEIVRRAD